MHFHVSTLTGKQQQQQILVEISATKFPNLTKLNFETVRPNKTVHFEALAQVVARFKCAIHLEPNVIAIALIAIEKAKVVLIES